MTFWDLAKLARPDDSGYFDGTVKRGFEREAGIPLNSVAWMRVRWPELELYLYQTAADDGSREAIEAKFDVTRVERPRDPNDVDWVMRLRIP